MLLKKDFLSVVEPLRRPGMGTELMAPLLYSLIRSLRPRSVVEAGMGYTTPFIAQALADNLRDFKCEALQLKTKLRLWNKRRQTLVSRHSEEELNKIHMECLLSNPPLSSPSYYCSEYTPIFYAVDSMTNKESSAPAVIDILQKLDLLHVVELHNSDFRGFLDNVDNQCLPFDLIWNDADGGGGAGFAELFELLNPSGGVMIFHDTLTNEAGQNMISSVKRAQATSMFNDFEIFNLLEPHKLAQTSATIIRRISGYKPKLFPASLTIGIEQEISQFLETGVKSRERGQV